MTLKATLVKRIPLDAKYAKKDLLENKIRSTNIEIRNNIKIQKPQFPKQTDNNIWLESETNLNDPKIK